MNYGVVLPIWQLTVAEAESLATRAEELGLDGVFVPDHILAKPATTQHYGGHWPDPFSLLAYLAGRTRRIRLGASVIVLPYRNALVAAKAAATVDQVSGGRFIFGVGVGWDEAEFADLRLPFRERGRLSDDYIRAIKAAWASDVPEYKGQYVSFAGATFSPRGEIGMTRGLVVATSAFLLVGITVAASATPGTGVSDTILAKGTSPEGIVVSGRGNTDVTVRQITIAPGGSTGWHYHEGEL